jgi:hypothetical protein
MYLKNGKMTPTLEYMQYCLPRTTIRIRVKVEDLQSNHLERQFSLLNVELSSLYYLIKTKVPSKIAKRRAKVFYFHAIHTATHISRGRDGSVGVTTGCGLEGPGMESR